MTLHIVHISDTHISNDKPQRLADLKNCIREINNLPQPADVVVHTGDISHDGLAQEYCNAKQELDQLNAPYFVIPGNRDNRAALLKEFDNKRYGLTEGGWVQYSLDQYAVRLIMLDTLCEGTNKGALCEERLHHLELMLAADNKKPVALFLHHTPYLATGIPDPYQYEDWNDVEKLKSVLARFDNIKGMYCGHVHRFIDGEIAGIKASAITCLAGDLRKGAVTDEERKLPVFRSIKL